MTVKITKFFTLHTLCFTIPARSAISENVGLLAGKERFRGECHPPRSAASFG